MLVLNNSLSEFLFTTDVESRCIPVCFRTVTTVGLPWLVQWLRLCAPNAGDTSSVPGEGARCYIPQRSSLQALPEGFTCQN